METIICPNCKSTKKIIKNGKRSGLQRYYCNTCYFSFTKKTKSKKIGHYQKAKAVQLYLEGIAIVTISRILNVERDTVNSWLSKLITDELKEVRLNSEKKGYTIKSFKDLFFILNEDIKPSGVLFTGNRGDIIVVSNLRD